ncbi:MAG: cation:dicarboxylase symporter family transporter, partial [Geodermatophilaceae bacterium]|nr:cation:dicarboxylase symporter family transporter [Geodermatophilaceae bacterium]
MSRPRAQDDAETEPVKKDRTHWLYMAVIAAVGLGILVGLVDKDLGVSLKPLGTGFVALIKMMISPIIFCTIVLGIGSVRKAAQVGRVGGLALGYFLIMSTFALAIGLIVGNLVQPGSGIDISPGEVPATDEAAGTVDFLLGIIPTTLVSP